MAQAGDMRIGGIFALSGSQQVKKSEARAGDTVALARLEQRPHRRDVCRATKPWRRRARLPALAAGLSPGDRGRRPQG